ncbi:MAG: DUF1499 domain-containing protein [Pseudomonadota bacterium]
MRLVMILAGIGVSVAVLFALYVRLAPSDVQAWHVDPRDVADPTPMGRYLLRDGEGDAAAPRFAGTPDAVMAKLHEVALGTPRVSVLAGNPDEGFVTYIARSRLFGFPDYVSVVAYADGDQTALAIYARLRFGQSDLGVNQARVDGWLSELNAA